MSKDFLDQHAHEDSGLYGKIQFSQVLFDIMLKMNKALADTSKAHYIHLVDQLMILIEPYYYDRPEMYKLLENIDKKFEKKLNNAEDNEEDEEVQFEIARERLRVLMRILRKTPILPESETYDIIGGDIPENAEVTNRLSFKT